MKLKTKLFAVIALLLAFSMVFTGCADAERSNDDDKRQEETQNKVESKPEDPDKDQEPTVEPVYEMKKVWLCVRTATEQWDGSGKGEKKYEYDEFGNLVSEINVTYGGSLKYEYDADGNQIRCQRVSEDGTVTSVTEMTYDKDGRLLTNVSKDADGNVSSEYSYSYDVSGHLVEELQKMHFSNTTYQYVLTYNNDYTKSTIRSFKNDEPVGHTVEYYDQNGNVLRSESFDAEGKWNSAMECEYDDQGRILLEKKYSKSETQADYDVIYTYNEDGLLIDKNVDYYYGYGTTYEYEQVEIKVRIN